MSSFGASAGGLTPELQDAIQRRMGSPVTSQVTNGAPTAQPMPQVQGNPQMMPQASMVSPGTPQGTPERVDDAHIILKAMAGRLKSQEKIAEAQSIPPSA